MKRWMRITAYYVITLVVIIMATFELPFVTNTLVGMKDTPRASGGVMDAKYADADGGERVYLRGEWEFYWNELLVTNNVAPHKPDLVVSLPSAISDYIVDGEKLTGGGYASYRLLLKGIKADEPLIVCVPNLASAYRVFIDGVCVFTSGKVSGSGSEVVSSTNFVANPITLDTASLEDGTAEIIIEVASRYSGGISMTPVLVNYDSYYSYAMLMLGVRYLFIGAMLFCALYAVVLLKVVKYKKYLIWLCALCVCLALRMMISCEGFWASQWLFYKLDYEMMNYIIYVSTFIIKLISLMYFLQAVPLPVKQNTLVVFSGILFLFASAPYFIAENIYDPNLFIALQFSSFLFDQYMLLKFCSAVADKVKWAGLHLVSYVCITVGIGLDILYTNGFIVARVSMLMPLLFFAFIVCSAFIHTKETSANYVQIAKTAELSEEIARLNMQLTLSQIQPHFLYNALNTIKFLTKRDPKKAEAAIVSFSNYLRGNMDSLTAKEPVPFEQELSHVNNYVSIEKFRFDDRLNMEYDIQCTSFSLPPLTVQPIVENAIKHGVNQKPEGGTVKISTWEDKKNYYVCVEDDGVGYNIREQHMRQIVTEADGSTEEAHLHVGLKNITSRLSYMLNATVDTVSVPGKGTKVTITVPKK